MESETILVLQKQLKKQRSSNRWLRFIMLIIMVLGICVLWKTEGPVLEPITGSLFTADITATQRPPEKPPQAFPAQPKPLAPIQEHWGRIYDSRGHDVTSEYLRTRHQ